MLNSYSQRMVRIERDLANGSLLSNLDGARIMIYVTNRAKNAILAETRVVGVSELIAGPDDEIMVQLG